MKYLYALACKKVPHGELYIMSTKEEWPEKRIQAILNHPELFRTPVRVERKPIPVRTESSP